MLTFTRGPCVCFELINMVENVIINRAMEVHLYSYIKGYTIWSPDQEYGEPWRAAVNCCSPGSTLSLGVTDGFLMCWWLNFVVSEIIIDIMSFRIRC